MVRPAMMLDPRTVARGWRQWTLTCDQPRASAVAAQPSLELERGGVR